MTSLVLVTCNQITYLKRCIESILRYTNVHYELIVVNQASTDGTKEYLDNLKVQYPSLVSLIHNTSNTGCSPGWNQGVKQSAGDPIVVLNDDIVVSPNWMRNLLEFRDKYPKDLFSAHVLPDSTDVRIIAETNPEEWERYCTSVVDKERHEIEEGFHGCCIGIPRDLLNAVGLFDEGFYKVAWEDVDYCHRVFKAGRKTQITHSSVIWHYGGVTQSYIGTREGHGHVHQNRMYFEKKWGIDTSNGICNRSIIWTRGKVGWEKVTCK